MRSDEARVTVVGEALVDLLWRRGAERVIPVPGGSPANVAVGLRRLGRPVTLVTTWGEDPPGELVRRYLADTGVEVCRVPDESGRTTLALAYLDESGAASYDFLAGWSPRELTVPTDTAVLHTGSLATVVEPGASRVLDLCRALRAQPGPRPTLVADLNVRPAAQPDRSAYRAACARLAATVDVVKASDEDCAWLFPERDPSTAARALLADGPRLVVLTLGERGALAVTADTEVTVPAPRVTVADTVGAGDAFQSALLDGLAFPRTDQRQAGGRWPPLPEEATVLTALLTRCVTAAALTCTRVGAQPPTLAELAAARPGAR